MNDSCFDVWITFGHLFMLENQTNMLSKKKKNASQQKHCSGFAFPQDEELFLVLIFNNDTCKCPWFAWRLHQYQRRSHGYYNVNTERIFSMWWRCARLSGQREESHQPIRRLLLLLLLSDWLSRGRLSLPASSSHITSRKWEEKRWNPETPPGRVFISVKMNSRNQECVEALRYLR